jgi:hypothetical protein
MPLKFWKREKPEKEKGRAEKPAKEEKAKEKGPKEKETEAKEAKREEKPVPPKEVPEEAAKPAPEPADVDALVTEAHTGLVDLGLTIPATKTVFAKRVGAYPGGIAAFADAYKTAPYRATTKLLADWLGIRAPADFTPETFLEEVNLRLSSFKLAVKMTDMTWLDQELSLRKGRLNLDGQEKVVRFKDARDLVRGINELLAPRKIVFLELETWSEEFAFMLVRDPKWDKLSGTDLVVVKAPQTAVGGECGECGAPVGANWHDCLSCGAVFGSD